MSHHCAPVGQTEAQDSGRSGKSEVRPFRGLKRSVGNFHDSGAVGKGQQLKKQRSREASKGWRSQPSLLKRSDKEGRARSYGYPRTSCQSEEKWLKARSYGYPRTSCQSEEKWLKVIKSD